MFVSRLIFSKEQMSFSWGDVQEDQNTFTTLETHYSMEHEKVIDLRTQLRDLVKELEKQRKDSTKTHAMNDKLHSKNERLQERVCLRF